MPNQSRSLPQSAADIVDSAMALVCSLPAADRNERRARVHAIISKSTSWNELENGISFSFENTDDMARSLLDLVLAERNCCAQFTYSIQFERQHQPIELRVEANGALVWLLRDMFLDSLKKQEVMSKMLPNAQRLPIASANATRVLTGVGVLACVVACVSLPSVVAAMSALGLGFLRNDRLLFPAEVLSLSILLLTFARSRARHGRNAPLLFGLAAAGWMFFGLMSPAPLGTIATFTGACAVVSLLVWDWRLRNRRAA